MRDYVDEDRYAIRYTMFDAACLSTFEIRDVMRAIWSKRAEMVLDAAIAVS
jgi:hypothetical protein